MHYVVVVYMWCSSLAPQRHVIWPYLAHALLHSTVGNFNTMPAWSLDTGHFFYTSPTQGPLFQGIPKGQESKSWVFFEGPRRFWGPQKQERKNNHNSIIFWAKNKMRRNFIWEKLMEFLLFNEVLKNLIFFQSLIKKVGVVTLILGKF